MHAATHRRDPQTAVDAAHAYEASGDAKTNRDRVLKCVAGHPGLTAPDIGSYTDLGHHEAQRRLSDLERSGLVRKGEPAACAGHRGKLSTWWPGPKPQRLEQKELFDV